tara:strand:- start:183 stop:524 length:342 start_codon:yes stop_codon:yes gene_type:complete
LLLLNFKFNISFPNTLIIKPIGVTTKKNIIPIINGEIILPNNNPNLNQILFKGVRIIEFIKPKNRKVKDIAKDNTLISPPLIKGYKATSKNTKKKTIPKFLFDGKLYLLLIKN